MTHATSKSSATAPSAILMAAGKGTRMGSDLPKVMHPVAGRPMLFWAIDAAAQIGAAPVVLVVGHGADVVERGVRAEMAGHRASASDAAPSGRDCVRGGAPASATAAEWRDIEFVVQSPQLGTGHAVDQARPLLEQGRLGRETFVLGGDGPLIRAATLHTLLEAHRSSGAAATLATSVIPDPSGYGRIVRSADGGLDRIVEERDASPEIRAIREVNPSYYCFDTSLLFECLAMVENTNAAREYYLTDVFSLLRARGLLVSVIDAVPPEDVLSINTPAQLAEVDGLLRARLAGTLAESRP